MDFESNLKANSQKLTAVFVGRSGCGKGTQAKLLINYLKSKSETPVFYLENGKTFRDLLQDKTYTGNLASSVNSQGGLQPEFLAIWAWSNLLVQNLRGDEHLIIDGVPRRFNEAPILDSAFKFYKREKPVIVHVKVSREWSKERLLSRGRSDDSEDVIEKRLSWFDIDALPAINYFREKPDYRLIEVNGEQAIEKVHGDLVESIFGTK